MLGLLWGWKHCSDFPTELESSCKALLSLQAHTQEIQVLFQRIFWKRTGSQFHISTLVRETIHNVVPGVHEIQAEDPRRSPYAWTGAQDAFPNTPMSIKKNWRIWVLERQGTTFKSFSREQRRTPSRIIQGIPNQVSVVQNLHCGQPQNSYGPYKVHTYIQSRWRHPCR